MRPTFMGLETAKRGIQVNQKAIDIVGNNISEFQNKKGIPGSVWIQ